MLHALGPVSTALSGRILAVRATLSGFRRPRWRARRQWQRAGIDRLGTVAHHRSPALHRAVALAREDRQPMAIFSPDHLAAGPVEDEIIIGFELRDVAVSNQGD